VTHNTNGGRQTMCHPSGSNVAADLVRMTRLPGVLPNDQLFW
jgi:hypothetical protein